MFGGKFLWIFFVVVFQWNFNSIFSSSICYSHDEEILCKSLSFSTFNASSFDSEEFPSISTLHLTNSYYNGFLVPTIKTLIIDDYLYEEFPSKFYSSSTLKALFIEHTFLNVFPSWLCASNRNLSLIEIDYSPMEIIVEHDLHLCTSLQTLRISHSNLKQFSTMIVANFSIQYLDLNHNQLSRLGENSSLDLNGFFHLKSLNLSSNRFRSISSENFNQTSALTTLDLSSNRLESFQINHIKHLNSLETLDLRGNLQLRINADWHKYFPHLMKIFFPYAHFCCYHKSMYERQVTKRSISISFKSSPVCYPLPDQMTPCESLFSSTMMRSIFMLIVFISVGSNLTALIINVIRLLSSSYNRWPISTILSSNLAMADFISSIYLILVGMIDLRFHDDFHNQTQQWTKSPLCKLAGFIYIFGIQSSIYALTLLTFERFYTILFSFKRQTPWPAKFTLASIAFGWFTSFLIASLPLININNFHANSLCVPFRIETLFDRIYLTLLIIFDLGSIGIIITCNGLICFNFSKSHVHTSNDARATLKILTLVVAICISRIPLIIFISLALIIHPTYLSNIKQVHLHFHDIKLAILFLQPFSSCFNPFMYSSLSTLRWTSSSHYERAKPTRKSTEFSRFRTQSERGYFPLRMMSITSLDYRLSSLPNTP